MAQALKPSLIASLLIIRMIQTGNLSYTYNPTEEAPRIHWWATFQEQGSALGVLNHNSRNTSYERHRSIRSHRLT